MDGARNGTAVGVFASRELAERAVDELLHAGFGPRQIGLAVPDEPFAASGLPATGLEDDAVGVTSFTGMGIAADEARRYEEELGSGCVVLAVASGRRYEDAVRILRDYGATFLDERARSITGYDTPVGTAETVRRPSA